MKLNQRTLVIAGILAAALVVLALQLVEPVYVVLVLAVLALAGLVAWSRVRRQAIAEEEADWEDWEDADEWGVTTDEVDEEVVDLDDRLAGFLADDSQPRGRGLFLDDPPARNDLFPEDDRTPSRPDLFLEDRTTSTPDLFLDDDRSTSAPDLFLDDDRSTSAPDLFLDDDRSTSTADLFRDDDGGRSDLFLDDRPAARDPFADNGRSDRGQLFADDPVEDRAWPAAGEVEAADEYVDTPYATDEYAADEYATEDYATEEYATEEYAAEADTSYGAADYGGAASYPTDGAAAETTDDDRSYTGYGATDDVVAETDDDYHPFANFGAEDVLARRGLTRDGSYDSAAIDAEFEELVEGYAAEEQTAEYAEEPPPVRERRPSIFAAPGVIDEERVDSDEAILEASRASQVKYEKVLAREDANAETREILSRVASLLAKYE